jgi:hypothetical protein
MPQPMRRVLPATASCDWLPDQTSRQEPPSNDQSRSRSGCSETFPGQPSQQPRECRPDGPPMDAKDKEASAPPSCGSSVIELYNTERPHSRLGWQTPAAFAQTFAPQRGLTLRNPQGSAPAPVAQPAQTGKTKTQSLAHAGQKLGATSSRANTTC